MFKQKNVMIVGIQFLKNNELCINYILKEPLNIREYRGLIPLSFKTKDLELFNDFTDFGKWVYGKFDSDGRIIDLY